MKEEQRLLGEEERDKARSARRMLELNAELQILHARGEGGRSAGSDSASVQSEPTSRFTVVSPHKLMAPFNDKADGRLGRLPDTVRTSRRGAEVAARPVPLARALRERH